jgi:hypothetical protein
MLRLNTKSTVPDHFPEFMTNKLSIQNNNWIRYSEHWKTRAIYNFGDSGTAIRTGALVPLLYPPPDRDALFINSDNQPVPGQYVYKRDVPPMDKKQAEAFATLSAREHKHFLDNMPLTDAGQSRFDRDTSVSQAYITKRTADDNAQHSEFSASISDASLMAVRVHDDHATYLDTAEPWNRSVMLYNMLASIHKYGDASTKFVRTANLISAKHDPHSQSFDEWVHWLNEHFAQFQVDFESDGDHAGYIHCGELKSFLFLHGTDRQMFRTVYDEQLRTTPTGRFKDTDALVRIFQQYHRSHKMSLPEPVSTQGGQAFSATQPAAKPAHPSANPKSAATSGKKPKTFAAPCPHCLKYGYTHHGHEAHECRRHIRKALAAATTSDTSTAATSTNPHSSDRLDRIEHSIESLMSFLSAAPATTDLQANSAAVVSESTSARLDRIEHLVNSLISVMHREHGEA